MTINQEESLRKSISQDIDIDGIVTWIGGNLEPDDVFAEGDLEDWALNNGFEKRTG